MPHPPRPKRQRLSREECDTNLTETNVPDPNAGEPNVEESNITERKMNESALSEPCVEEDNVAGSDLDGSNENEPNVPDYSHALQVLVGKDDGKTMFFIPRVIAVKSSDFFSALAEEHEGDCDMKIQLVDHLTETFNMYLHWLYTAELKTDKDDDKHFLLTWARAYALGTAVADQKFRTALLGNFNRKVPDSGYPKLSNEAVHTIFTGTEKGCAAWNYVFNHWLSHTAPSEAEFKELPADVVFEYMLAAQKAWKNDRSKKRKRY